MAALVGIKGRDPDQPVDTRFLAKVSERKITLHPDGDTLYPGLLSRHRVEDLGFIAFAFGVSQVHPQEHLGPVLGFGPASAGMDGEESVTVVVLFEKKSLEFSLFEAFRQVGKSLFQLSADVLSFGGELGQDLDLLFFRF